MIFSNQENPNQRQSEEKLGENEDTLNILRNDAFSKLWLATRSKNSGDELRKHYKTLEEIIPGIAQIQKTPEENFPTHHNFGTPKIHDIWKWKHTDQKNDPEKKRFDQSLLQAVQGVTLIDLGAGRDASYDSGGYGLATLYRAANYVPVEKNNAHDLTKALYAGVYQSEEEHFYVPGVSIVEADMLDFLRALPDRCPNICILISGIDHDIIAPKDIRSVGEREKCKQYWKDLSDAVNRVLPTGGHLITYAGIEPAKECKIISQLKCAEGDARIWEHL